MQKNKVLNMFFSLFLVSLLFVANVSAVVVYTPYTDVLSPAEYDATQDVTFSANIDTLDNGATITDYKFYIDDIEYPVSEITPSLYESTVSMTGLPTPLLGSHTYNFSAVDDLGDIDMQSSIFTIVDTTAPVVSVTGTNPDTVECGSTPYVDAGATAIDNYDSAVTASTTGVIDTLVLGLQTLNYYSTDSSLNTGNNTRNVTVQDTLAPTIVVDGTDPATVELGDSYTDAGATATDACEGVSSVVGDTTDVDTSVEDTYTVTYDLTDSTGNVATQATRSVVVSDSVGPTITVDPITSPVDYDTTVTVTATISDLSDVDSTNVVLEMVDTDTGAPITDFTAVTLTETFPGSGIYTGTFNTADLGALGDFTAQVTATDLSLAANEGTGSTDYTIDDLSAPEVTDATAVDATVCYGDDIAASLTGTDNYYDPINDVAINLYYDTGLTSLGDLDLTQDSVDPTLYTRTINSATDLLGYGDYDYSYVAIDGSSNSADTSAFTGSFTVVDCSVPTITNVVADDELRYNVDDFVLSADIEDLESGISDVTVEIFDGSTLVDSDVMEDDDFDGTYDVTFPTADFDLGTYTYTITATNGDGYTETYSSFFDVTDGVAPTINSAGLSGAPVVYGDSVTLFVYVTDDVDTDPLSSVTVALDADPTNVITLSYTGTATEYSGTIDTLTDLGGGNVGIYHYTVTAIDSAGNTATSSTDVSTDSIYGSEMEVVDLTAPTVTVTDTPDPVNYGDDITVTTTVTDDIADNVDTDSVELNIDGIGSFAMSATGNTDEYAVTLTTSDVLPLALATYTYNVSANDSSEFSNTGYALGSFEVVDTGLPVITLNGDDSVHVDLGGTYTEEGATAVDSYDGNLTSFISIDATDVDTATEGTYSVYYDVVDSEGNAAATVTRTVEVSDITAPTITDSSISATRVNQNDTVSFSVDTEDDIGVTSVTILINGVGTDDMTSSDGVTYTYDFDTTGIALGTYSYLITVSDDAGNTDTVSGSFTITYISAIDVSIHADKTSGEEDLDVSFTSSETGGVSPLTYSWDFGDDESSADKNTRHVYTDAGTYTATLTVFDQYGNIGGSASVTITVDAKQASSDPKNNIKITSLSLTDGVVTAGDALEVSTKVENIGEDRLDDVSLTVSIPELGIWYRTAGKNIRHNGDTTFSAALDIPADVAPGVYDVRIEVSNDDFERIKYRDVEVE